MEWHKYKLDKSKLKDVADVMELYKIVGFNKLFEMGMITDVRQMAINPKTCEELGNLMSSNWCKHDKARFLKADKIRSMISFDWMNYSPVCNDEVPEWEIWWHEK